MLNFLRNLCAPPAAAPPLLPAVAPSPTFSPAALPILAARDSYPPRLGTTAIFFDEHFTLCLARSYDDLWASESSLLASSTRSVAVWVRNQRDELVAYHKFDTAPIHLGNAWWPGMYSLTVEHPDFQDVLCVVKRGPWTATQMPPLDLLAPPDAPLPAMPTEQEPHYPLLLSGQRIGSPHDAEPGTGATLVS